MSLILAAVAGLNVVSLVWLLRGGGRGVFRRGQDEALDRRSLRPDRVLLGATREAVRFPILLVDRFFPGWGWLEILALAVLCAWVGERMSDPGRSPAIRSRVWRSSRWSSSCSWGWAGRNWRAADDRRAAPPVPAVIVAGPIYGAAGIS